jgi:hypothetical protein
MKLRKRLKPCGTLRCVFRFIVRDVSNNRWASFFRDKKSKNKFPLLQLDLEVDAILHNLRIYNLKDRG